VDNEIEQNRRTAISRQCRELDLPFAVGYPAVTKVINAASPAAFAAAKASSIRPPIPRSMAAILRGLNKISLFRDRNNGYCNETEVSLRNKVSHNTDSRRVNPI
jgi:hypothetical protein